MLLTAEETPDGYGHPQRNWVQDGGLRWVSIKALRPTGAFAAAQAQTNETHTIRMSWSMRGPTTRHRIMLPASGRTFSITRVIDVDERHMVHECWATERTDGTSLV